jgi:cellulose synthase/poly-beta-1,6-N-acetylglucosamine synthase-like glycosyltransferase/spore germination protein YaaH/peptidoglycan/xylan/chitin deacetylase (PgdA/CDA1 family)
MADKQVFQADSQSRWLRFKWISRVLLVVLVLAVVAAVIAITSKKYPDLPNLNEAPKALSKQEIAALKKTEKYRKFTLQVNELKKLEKAKRLHQLKQPNNKDRINAGFYMAWDPQAYTSLADNMNKLDMVVSEGFVITPNSDTITTHIDTGLMRLNKKYKKPILISISNYINTNSVSGDFDTKDVDRVIRSKKSRTTFINSIANQLTKYNFRGVDLDFDNIDNRKTTDYIAFEKELYKNLHAKGFLVTQNVVPDDEQYDVVELQHYNDFLFVMAIDQHDENSDAGDLSNQVWVEQILDDICSKIPSEKVILTIAGGAYDWPTGSIGKSISYQQAISTAQEKQKEIIYDPASANLHYSYSDQVGMPHTVYFTDAATNFNVIRMADDWATGGVALWRLGEEDPRLWTFFQKNLSIDSLRKTGIDIKKLTDVGLNNRISYTGDGEVLDLVTIPTAGKIDVDLDTAHNYTITNQTYIKLPTKYVIRRYGYAPNKIVLTFDDGPDPDYTPRILDILKREHCPAAFFVVGSMAEKNIQILRREFDEGYEIGNHTYFHPDISAISQQRVNFELSATRSIIESVTGRSTILFRPPYNADAEPQTTAEIIPVAEARKQSYITVGESIDPWDWYPGVTADSIIARVERQKDAGSFLLLHDAGGETREETVKALPAIIHFFRSHGYTFTTIADVLHQSKDELMPPIRDDADSGVIGFFYQIYVNGLFYINWFLIYLFLTAIFLALARVALIGVLALKQFADSKKLMALHPDKAGMSPVSIIVPAYNEEVTALKTIESLLKIDYAHFEIIFVNDGSKDKTFEVVNKAYPNHPLVKVLDKPNGGKASALNFGITHANHAFVVCIDADTQLKDDAVYHLMTYFTDDEIGAVAGTVKVGNTNNIITNFQSIEYITAQNMDRRAFDLINSITVVPGAIGAFRKSAIFKAGGFTYDTLAEDCDLTMRILKAGYIIRNCAEAIAYTEAPETLSGLLNQRFRWSFGVIQSFWKNRDALFNKRNKFFGMVGMPNILLFQIILPLFSPLADLMMIVGLCSGKWQKIVTYYVVFILVDFVVGIVAFWMEKEDYKKLLYIIPQRFIWRQLMYYILFKSIRKAVKGELSGWGTVKRTGNVVIKEKVSTA